MLTWRKSWEEVLATYPKRMPFTLRRSPASCSSSKCILRCTNCAVSLAVYTDQKTKDVKQSTDVRKRVATPRGRLLIGGCLFKNVLTANVYTVRYNTAMASPVNDKFRREVVARLKL